MLKASTLTNSTGSSQPNSDQIKNNISSLNPAWQSVPVPLLLFYLHSHLNRAVALIPTPRLPPSLSLSPSATRRLTCLSRSRFCRVLPPSPRRWQKNLTMNERLKQRSPLEAEPAADTLGRRVTEKKNWRVLRARPQKKRRQMVRH